MFASENCPIRLTLRARAQVPFASAASASAAAATRSACERCTPSCAPARRSAAAARLASRRIGYFASPRWSVRAKSVALRQFISSNVFTPKETQAQMPQKVPKKSRLCPRVNCRRPTFFYRTRSRTGSRPRPRSARSRASSASTAAAPAAGTAAWWSEPSRVATARPRRWRACDASPRRALTAAHSPHRQGRVAGAVRRAGVFFRGEQRVPHRPLPGKVNGASVGSLQPHISPPSANQRAARPSARNVLRTTTILYLFTIRLKYERSSKKSCPKLIVGVFWPYYRYDDLVTPTP